MNKCNQCPYCRGTAEIKKTSQDFANSTIYKYYVECTECGASTEQYNTYFAYFNGRGFHVMTEREAVSKAICDWNNGIFDVSTRLSHMSDTEKIL